MRRIARKTWTLLAIMYALMTEYRAELILWCLGGVFPFLMLGIWHEVAVQTGRALPMDTTTLARYFLAAFLVRQLTVVWVIWEFEYHVVTGRLSPYLLQPLDFGWRMLAAHLSEQVARVPFGLILIALFLALYPQAAWLPTPRELILGAISIYLAFTLRFLMQYSLAMLCFWYERASSLEQLQFLAYLFLSGMVAPLGFYPAPMRHLLMWTPFPYMLDLPANLLIGHSTSVPIGQAMAIVGGWIVAFYLLNRWLWHRGVRQYSAMGA